MKQDNTNDTERLRYQGVNLCAAPYNADSNGRPSCPPISVYTVGSVG